MPSLRCCSLKIVKSSPQVTWCKLGSNIKSGILIYKYNIVLCILSMLRSVTIKEVLKNILATNLHISLI